MIKIVRSNTAYYLFLSLILMLCIYSTRTFFIEQYMRFALRDEHIVVSLSTTPYRIGRIFTTLNSLKEQNVHIAQVYLNIPHIFKRDNIGYIIPKWLDNYKNLTILRTSDYGPATKLLGVLSHTNLPAKSIIVTVDDDISYPKNMILHLAYAAMRNPQAAVGLSGAEIYKPQELVQKKDQRLGLKAKYSFNGKVTILQGYAGVAYHRNFFNADILDVAQLPQYCIYSDDIYFSFYLASKNIERLSIANRIFSLRNINPDTSLATSNTALQNLDPPPFSKNVACIKYLKNKNPSVIF